MKMYKCHVIYLHGHLNVLCHIFTRKYTCSYPCIIWCIYMKMCMYHVIYLHEDTHALWIIFAWSNICIMWYSYMKICTQYVIYLHEDIHVSCNVFTWWSTRIGDIFALCIMQSICMKINILNVILYTIYNIFIVSVI